MTKLRSMPPAAAILLLPCMIVPQPAAAVDPEDGGLTTAEYLEMPELFQLTVVAGAMSVLVHFTALDPDPEIGTCVGRWTLHGDVVAVVASHARRNPGSSAEPFADTLVEALRARCDESPE